MRRLALHIDEAIHNVNIDNVRKRLYDIYLTNGLSLMLFCLYLHDNVNSYNNLFVIKSELNEIRSTFADNIPIYTDESKFVSKVDVLPS